MSVGQRRPETAPPRPGGRGFLHPGMMPPPAKSKDFRGSASRLAGRLQPERGMLAAVVVLGALSVVFAIVGPKLLGNATNVLFEGVINQRLPAGATQEQVIAGMRARGQDQLADMLSAMELDPGASVDYAQIARILITLATVYLISSVFGWAQQYLMAGVAQRTMFRLREDVDRKLGRLPLRFFDDTPRGDVLSRVTNDIDNISTTLQQSLTQIVWAVLTIFGVLIMMLTISPLLALLSIVAVPVSFYVTIRIAKRSQVRFADQWRMTGEVDGYIEEVFTGHSIVKVFGKQRRAAEAFDGMNGELYEASFRAQFISGIIQPAMFFISNLNYVAICVVGGLMVANGRISLGEVQAFIQYTRQFTQPITQTAAIMNVLQSTVASAERVFELLDETEEDPDEAEPAVLETTEGHITLRDVTFRYLPDVPLIDDLDLDVPAGETVAIVGPTGAGKTTLVNLLLRFYELDAGSIALDGVDTRTMARSGLRRLFGMVLQDPWLFRGTIRDNIAYGREDATEEEIEAAARAARVDHFVHTLPEGYDTIVDDDSSNLSQGEKQLLTIARAFLVDPQILILDEATSSVDTRTEVLIQDAMAELMRDRTSFVIAHRLSTVRGAHTILVMDRGRIVEHGNHRELLERGGFYHDLYHSQFLEALEEAS
ncbi:MAG TPA: ABC transporter ATP-binding protein [Actinomycetota bacterium]|nr:ABC transporter ATP-binding protein [Actinomycetota bacterium]